EDLRSGALDSRDGGRAVPHNAGGRMSRSHFTALAAALAFGAFASRLMAQDASSTTPTRPDTSGYTTGAGGADTSAHLGRVGATDTAGAGDTSATRIKGDTSALQPGADSLRGTGGMTD